MTDIDKNLYSLLEQDDWGHIQLASQLIKGLGYQEAHISKLIEKITTLFVKDILPDMDYHRFGCTMLDKMTFDLIFKKLNEFIQIAFIEIEVCADALCIKSYILRESDQSPQIIQVSIEELTASLFYSLRAKFEIGKKPPTC